MAMSLRIDPIALSILICLVVCSPAAELHRKAHSKRAHRQSLAAEAYSLLGSRLRGNGLGGWADDAQDMMNDDSDDDEEDDDEANAQLAIALAKPQLAAWGHSNADKAASKAEPVAFHKDVDKKVPKDAAKTKEEEKKEPPPHGLQAPANLASPAPAAVAKADAAKDETSDEEEGDEDEEDDDEEEEEEEAAAHEKLEAAKEKKKLAKSKLEAFEDDQAFQTKIAKDVKVISNETQSPVLSNFLGELRLEMHEYAKPTYSEYLKERAEKAEKKVKELEKELEQDKDKSGKEGVQKGETKKEHGEENVGGKEGEGRASSTWAISFFANVAMLAVVFAMASTKNDMVRNYTWFLIDQVIAVFLAVMYFQAFDSFLDFNRLGVHNTVVASILHAISMLAIAIILAYKLRRHDVGLAILCGCGAHVVSFASIHAAAGFQNYLLGFSYANTTCIFGIAVLAIALLVIGFLVHTAKKRAQALEEANFMEKSDDVENDFASMAFSVVWTMFVRYLLTGHHPVDDETAPFDHTATQRAYMLIYACLCLPIAGFGVKFCSQKAAVTESYAVKRIMSFFTTVLCMNVAWAFLYWGEWEFFEALYPDDLLRGRVMFAVLATTVGGLALVGLCKIPAAAAGLGIRKERLVALTAVGLVVAWSWELCFDSAIESMVEGDSHPVAWKITATILMMAILVPVYAYYVKPISGPAAEAIGA